MNPIAPSQAQTIYLEHRSGDVTPATLQSTEYRLNHFVRWCGEEGIETMDELEVRDMHDYCVWRRNDGDLSPASEKGQMDSMRVFIRYCERLDYVEQDLSQAVVSPTLSQDDRRRDDIVEYDKAEAILSRLDRFRYASREHVLFLLGWRTAMRTGALRALDVRDYHPTEEFIEVVNRPEQGTRLKNGGNGERHIALSTDTCTIINDYLTEQRIGESDEFGREPLLSTRNGRVAKNTIRGVLYRLTRPCWYSDECPHGREIDDCAAATEGDRVYECPSSTAPHSLRRGSITHMLRSDVPEKIVSDRANVSETVLDEHYDKRSEWEKMELRRQHLEGL